MSKDINLANLPKEVREKLEKSGMDIASMPKAMLEKILKSASHGGGKEINMDNENPFKERIKTHHTPRIFPPNPASEDELFKALSVPSDDKDGVIYFHIPFCDNICSFCSMNRTKLENELDDYTKFLLDEIAKFGNTPYLKSKKIKSIYFGGGTPTTLKENHFERIFNEIYKYFSIDENCEISLESTLHNLNVEKIKFLEKIGVNRFSIGIQTFSDHGRKFLNRVYNGKQAIAKFSDLRENFDGMLCTDIIYNYPNESLDDVKFDAQNVINLGVDSTSFYSLMYFDGSKLSKDGKEFEYDLKHDNALHNEFAKTLLESGEFELLELTKLARKNRDTYEYIRHTHKGTDILPLGNGAGGKIAGFGMFGMGGRKMISKNSPNQVKFEKLCNLFQYQSLNLSEFKILSDNIKTELFAFLKECENMGFGEFKNGKFELSLNGVFWGNNIAVKSANIIKKEFIK